jgi:hypothetical protein
MLPRVDVGELVLEVMTWHPQFVEEFSAASGSQTRLSDIHVTMLPPSPRTRSTSATPR